MSMDRQRAGRRTANNSTRSRFCMSAAWWYNCGHRLVNALRREAVEIGYVRVFSNSMVMPGAMAESHGYSVLGRI